MALPPDEGTKNHEDALGSSEEGFVFEHLRPLSRTTLSGEIASRIRELISGGSFKPGERIPSERELAEQLGVGRPAIREALQELKAHGILVSGRGPQGTRVATSSLSQVGTSLAQLLGSGAERVRELMELRASVEIEAAGLAARRASLEDTRRLADSVVKPGEVTSADSDVSFHLSIAGATGNALYRQIVQEVIELLHEHTQAVLQVLYNQPGGIIAIQRQHEAVVEAIRLGNEDRAREEMRTHMQYVTKGLSELTGSGTTIRLIIADLDGTIMERPKVITDRTKRAVAAVRKVGAEVVLASARPPRSIRYYHRELRLTTPVIAYNGALLWDLLTGIPLAQISLTPQLAGEMVQLGRELGTEINIEANDEWFADRISERLSADLREYTTLGEPQVGKVDEILASDTPLGKVVLDIRDLDEKKRKEARNTLIRHFEGQSHITETVPGLLDMISADASKAVMAQRLARSLNVTADQVLGIGDHENDVPLLRWAGVGVAMGNAIPAAKEAADVVTSSNQRDGVAEALERWVLDRPQGQTPF